jgi:hypothetical protein
MNNANNMTDSPDEIEWHPAFYAAAELELKDNMDELKFEREYNLSKEPLRIDLLIQKDGARTIKNEIGHIMRKYNIIEYKSPRDKMSIDDFYKTLGYACLYKGYGSTVNTIPKNELTVSMFRVSHPRKMFEDLNLSGHRIEKKYPGIYYVTDGLPFPVQVVVIRELDFETHSSLRILTDKVDIKDVRLFLKQARKMNAPGDRNNIDAVLKASVAANFELYEEVRRDSVMCDALRELMKDEIEEGREEGREEGILETLFGLVRDDIISMSEAAKRANMTEASFMKNIEKFKA